jgi:hypothetical protein
LPAKIGENESQIEKRYGKPVREWDDVLGYCKSYRWQGFNVGVNFVDGISRREFFSRTLPWPDHPDRDKFYARHIRQEMKKDRAFLAQDSGLGKNGVILADENGYSFTTKKFEIDYDAASKVRAKVATEMRPR